MIFGEEPFAVGSVVAGKLRIVRPLGAGGMGAVYEVEHEITRHRRALKLLHAQMSEVPGVVERFLREASAAGRIGNPHIVETFDAGRLDGGEPYIVMELLRGRSLAEQLNLSGPLEVTTACDILVQACDGVAAAHAAGIIHRDLKPENLFLAGAECSYVKILDFGISKFDAAITGMEGFTLEGSPIGTPYYMSPEQVRGQKTVDVSTDVYALGVVLYECLTGRRPFDADNLPQLIYLISQGQYVAPSALRPSLPKALDVIVARSLALERSERYGTAVELAQALSQLRQSLAPPALEPQPPMSSMPPIESNRGAPALTPDVFLKSAAPPAPTEARLERATRRRWLWGTLGAVGIGAAVTGIAFAMMNAKHTLAVQQSMGSTGPSTPTQPMAEPTGLVVHNGTPSGIPNTAASALSPGSAAPIAVASNAASAANAVTPVVAPVATPAPSALGAAALHASELPAKPQPKAGPKPANSTSSGNRAAAVGLSEENPFK